LKKSISADNGQIKFDELAIKLESMTLTREEVASHVNPFYDTSTTRESLMTDFNDGMAAKYKTKPHELRASKPEYKCFRPNVFTSITTENYAIKKKRLVGNIGEDVTPSSIAISSVKSTIAVTPVAVALQANPHIWDCGHC
jgi:hypothetical protein